MKREKIIQLCDQIVAFSYYALIYFLPISIALSESFAGATLFFFFVKRGVIFSIRLGDFHLRREKLSFKKVGGIVATFLKSFKPETSCLSKPIGFFILVCALSILKSEYLSLSLQGFFFKVLQWTFLYFVFIECIKTRRQLNIFISVFFVSALLVSINGLVQYFSGAGFIFNHSFSGRVNSSFRHANDFGAYLVLVCPVLLCLLLNYRFAKQKNINPTYEISFIRRKFIAIKIFTFILFLLAVACLGLTYSRGAWYSFFIALLFLWWQKRNASLVNILLIVLFISIFSPMLRKTRGLSILSDYIVVYDTSIIKEKVRLSQENEKNNHVSPAFRLKKLLGVITSSTGSGREGFWKGTVSIIKESPVLGTGINTYSRVSQQHKLQKGGYPHNSYLHMAAEIGLVGLAVFLWGIVTLFRNSMRNLRLIKDSYLASLSLGLLAGLLGFWIHSFLDTNFYSVQLANIMWVAMGVLVVAQKVGLQQAKS